MLGEMKNLLSGIFIMVTINNKTLVYTIPLTGV